MASDFSDLFSRQALVRLYRTTRGNVWLSLLLLLLVAIFMISAPRSFLSWPIYESFLSTIPLYGILALGLTLVVATGEMDLCFPSTLAIAGLGCAVVLTHTGSVGLALLTALAIGTVVGALNGVLVALVGVPSIIATIGTQFFWRGVVMLASQGVAVSLAPFRDSAGASLLVGRAFGVLPMQAVWMTGLALLLWGIFNRHPAGDAMRFVGENAETASRLGVPVPLTRLGVHTLMGLCAGFAGAVGCLEMGSWWPTQGEGAMLLVFAAVFIGGTSVYGGSARVYGTLVGAIIVGMIEAGIISAGLSGFWTRAVHGLVIVLAVSSHAVLSVPPEGRPPLAQWLLTRRSSGERGRHARS